MHDVIRCGIRYIHAISLGHQAGVVGSGDGTKNRSLLLVVGQTLAGEEGATTLGDLDDDRRLDVTNVRVRDKIILSTKQSSNPTERPRERR